MKYSQMLKVVLLFIANWLIVGIGFFILTQSIYPDIQMSEMLYCAGIWGVSAIMGILAIFAPSGIGVREGIMIWGLSQIMPLEYAMVISVVSRLWQTIPELVLVALAFIWSRIRKMSKIRLKRRRAPRRSFRTRQRNKATPHKDHILYFVRILLAYFPSFCTIRPCKALALLRPHCTI